MIIEKWLLWVKDDGIKILKAYKNHHKAQFYGLCVSILNVHTDTEVIWENVRDIT
jgi:hypothetical protein